MKPAPLKGDPILAATCSEEWLAERRAILRRSGQPVRAGEGNTIEIKSLTPREQLAAHDPLHLNQWLRLALPLDATAFVTAQDRDAVLTVLQRGHP